MGVTIFHNMIGKVMKSVTSSFGDDQMLFEAEDGSLFRFYHNQDCCESVGIEDISGDLSDLVGSPITLAEEVDNIPDPSFEGIDDYSEPDSFTWTFYKFATAVGSVVVRWLGTSNGYYSEGVDFSEETINQ